MFREMRRKNQVLPMEECERIMHSCTSGVLALLGDEDYPYAVPMSHLYMPGRLYFHGAMEGHRADAVRRCGKASFCVVAQDDVAPAELATHYRSVIAFGRIRVVEDDAEKRSAIMALAERFAPGMRALAEKETADCWHRMKLFALDIEHMTGKEALALAQKRAKVL